MPEQILLPGLKAIRRRPEAWLFVVILIVGAVFALTARDFLSLPNVIDLLETYSVQAIMAMGLFVVLVSGGIDISFAATASVAQYSAALIATPNRGSSIFAPNTSATRSNRSTACTLVPPVFTRCV